MAPKAPMCKAKAKSTGEPCKKRAALGTTVCVEHGARGIIASRGPGAKQYKHGAYSEFGIPANLRTRFDQSMADPELLSARRNVALLDALLEESLTKHDAAGNVSLWMQANRHYTQFSAALGAKDDKRASQELAALQSVLQRGLSDAEARKATRELIQEQDRVMASERKRLVDMQMMVTGEQLMAILDRVALSVERNVADDGARAAIGQDIMAVLHHQQHAPSAES